MRRYVTEFIGTFFLVLTIGLTVLQESPFAPLVIGASLMVMVYMGGHVSGAHYNPAVSLALLMRGKLSAADFVPYVIAQLAGAFVAAFTVRGILGRTFAPSPGVTVGNGTAIMVEALFTFALALVVLNVATARKTEGNSFYGLAIGFTVAVGAFAGGAISGGAFNPAVGLGPTLVHSMMGPGSLSHAWIYIVGPCLGAVVAALVFGMQEEPVGLN